MSEIDTLVCDLQAIARASNLAPALCQRVEDAATALTTLSQHNAKLVEALTPFADFADVHGYVPDEHKITVGSSMAKRQLTMADCRAARQALNEGVQP